MSRKTYSQKNPNTNILQRAGDIEQAIAEVVARLNQYKEIAKEGRANWGHVGDTAYWQEQIDNINAGYAGEGK